MKLYGGIEAGGTKFVCVVATGPVDPLVAELKIPTTAPLETLEKVASFFKGYDPKALGVTSFGPLDLRRGSPTYGYITDTPKRGWRNTSLARFFEDAFGVPVGFDTDVNASVLGETRYGAANGLDHVVYITVGTGIGGGAVVNGEVLHGLVHPEMGHLPVRRHLRDVYQGCCTFHGDCLEGLACGPAIEARWGRPAAELPSDHEAWEFEAYYLAQAVCAIVYTMSPQRIIFGGGVMNQKQLYPVIRQNVVEMLHDYIQTETIIRHIDEFIMEPGLGERSGVVGALELARRAERELDTTR